MSFKAELKQVDFHAAIRVWRRNYLQFKKSLLVNFFWIVIEPLLFLLALGYGLGTYVTNIEGVPFSEFYFPALLCNTAMMVAFFESTYANFSKLTHQQTYTTMILTPIEPAEIVIGEVVWGASKGFLSALGVTLVASLFGLVTTWAIVPALIVIFFLSFLFSAIGMIVTSLVRNYDGIIYPTSGLIIPMSLFSGTYFPVDQLPLPLKYLSYVLPLTHGVSAVRTLLLKDSFGFMFLLNILVIIVLCVLALRIAFKRIQEKLVH